jgi:hypothetical protein
MHKVQFGLISLIGILAEENGRWFLAGGGGLFLAVVLASRRPIAAVSRPWAGIIFSKG